MLQIRDVQHAALGGSIAVLGPSIYPILKFNGAHYGGTGWNPKAGMDVSEKRKISCIHGDSHPGPSVP